MPDLKSQLADYFDHVVQRVGVSEINGEYHAGRDPSGAPPQSEADNQRGDDLTFFIIPQPGERTVQPEPRRWIGVAAAVAAAILVVAGFVVVGGRDRGETETGSVPSPTVTHTVPSPSAADPVVSPSVLDPVSSYRWSRVPYSAAVFGEDRGQEMSSVTVGGPGLVAVGEWARGQEYGSAVWTSVDGTDWSRVPVEEAIFADASIRSVTAGGPGLVAVGVAYDAVEPGTDAAAVWTSPDGITWSRVPHDEAIFDDVAMTSVIAGGPGLVAVGWDGHPHGEVSNAVVWTSVDGLAWSRVPHDEAVFGHVTGAWMHSVTVGGPGLVAVGQTNDFDLDSTYEDHDHFAAVWTSRDGLAWSRVPHDEAIFAAGTTMNSVTAGGPGMVAVGNADDVAAVWTSVDGTDWSRVPHDEAFFGGEGTPGGSEWIGTIMNSVTAGGSSMVAVGLDAMGAAAVWTSVDGITWSRALNDDAVFGARPRPVLEMSSVVTGGPGLVAVGANRVRHTYGTTESEAAVWVATFEDCSDGSCSDDVTGEAD